MQSKKPTLTSWFKSGEPWLWLNASAVALSIIAVIGLLLALAVNGFAHFWVKDIQQASYYVEGMAQPVEIAGEVVDRVDVSVQQLVSAGFTLDTDQPFYERQLLKQGNRDVTGTDFAWYISDGLSNITFPRDLIILERREWGNFYGRLMAIEENAAQVSSLDLVDADTLWEQFEQRLERALLIHDEIYRIEKHAIGKINHGMERLRLAQRKLELQPSDSSTQQQTQLAELAAERKVLDDEYAILEQDLADLYQSIGRDSIIVSTVDNQRISLSLEKIVRANRPNAMSLLDKIAAYLSKLWEFLSDDPREANTEGGIFPAIFGTVMMVMLMSIMVTPFGVVAAVYLREYAKQGPVTQAIRIAVNNLAGVPSIVYGVFGLGFFIYFIGQNIDELLFAEALPSPTFGTPGLLWASLTLALLTVPVVIVATEEGLARIPKAVREGSLALGATKAETLWRVVLPMASPAMMTGLILAVARAAGEVAPLMLVGVVKLAPSLPLDGNFPYLHLDQKFMHLGFHIYDVGFQSPNVEAARPLVYATALLLVIVIALLNFAAVAIRNQLREKYKSLEH